MQHLGYSWLYGTFKDFDGTFTFDEKNPAADKVNVTINTTSVDTNHAERDKHLRSADSSIPQNIHRQHSPPPA
ncbi:YceI family protein [Escherichia coli]